MSKINDLIKELCPNGVVFKKIGDCCNFQNGFAFKRNLFKNSGDVLLRITNINGKTIDLDDVKYIDVNDYKVNLDSFKVNDNDIVIAMSGATTGKVGINKTNKVLYLNQRVGKIVPKDIVSLNNHFLYHILLSKVNYFYKLAGGGAQPNLSSESIKNTIIPIPPIEVQDEIVRILDKFDELEMELELELELRKRQYEFWRGKLMKLENILYKTMPLSEVYEFKYGTGNTIPDISGEYPVYGSNGIVGTHNEYNSENAPVIGHIGAYAGIVNWASGKHFVTYNGVICNKINNDVDSRYAYYLLLNENFLGEQKGAQPFVSYDSLNKPIVKIPDMKIQKKIVDILDRFYILVNDISYGLPAEIELRRKQYEYYRNKLLSFEEMNVDE